MTTNVALDERELAHVLFALRFLQANLSDSEVGEMLAESEHLTVRSGGPLAPMDGAEIDALCERINT